MTTLAVQSRPPGIYKQHYLEELVSRYHGNMSEVSVPGIVGSTEQYAPEYSCQLELPEWCLVDGEERGGAEEEENAPRKRRKELQKEVGKSFSMCLCD